MVKLGRPHLVLAHFGGDNRLALGQFVQFLDHELGLDHPGLLDITERVLDLPLLDLLVPGLVLVLALLGLEVAAPVKPGIYRGQGVTAVGHQGNVHPHVLADRTGVDVDMDDLGMGGKGVDSAGDPVVEAGPHRDQEIAIGHRHVGEIGAVHPQHSHAERIGAGKAAQPHESHGHRDVELLGQFSKGVTGIAEDHPAAGVNHRPFGLEHRLAGLLHLAGMGFVGGTVGPHLDRFRVRELDLSVDHVLGQIDQNRAGPAAAGQMKGLADGGHQIVRVLDQIVMLGHRPGDPDDIHFLEGVVADQHGRHLAGEDHHRNRIAIGRSNAGHGIGGAGAGGNQGHPHLALDPAIGIGGMDRRLFVANQNVGKFLGPQQFVVKIDDRAAGKSEDNLDSLFFQALDECLRSSHLLHRIFPACGELMKGGLVNKT